MKKSKEQKGQSTAPDLFNNLFNGNHIGFELINATEMAKVFDKKVGNFLQNDSTKNFIKSCLKSWNSSFLKVEKEEDLIVSKQKSGTWMHRVLAIKFAAWLNPDFEVWVFTTIDDILFGHFRRIEDSLKASAKRRLRLDELGKLLGKDDRFLEYLQLQSEERRAANARGKYASKQREAYEESYQQD